jgi:uncharacterized YigZ family protein
MKQKRYLIPAEETRSEITVINSRFISTAGSAFSVDEAKAFIQRIKSEFADASHNVPAYVIGHGSSVIAHCNDDGEPSGTAGRPALAVLQGSGVGDIAVVVTRYFGGTKLSKGGLVRAYSESVRSVLEVLPMAERVATHTVMLETPYPLYERMKLLIPKHDGQILDQEFAAQVTLTIRFAVENLADFEHDVRELSQDKIEIILCETNSNTILPITQGKSNPQQVNGG